MRVLFLTFYYEPDLSAGSFRATSLVEALQSNLPVGSTIDVITTSPNRYHSFSTSALEIETINQLRIKRIKVCPHRSGFLDQSRAFICYALGAARFAMQEEYDLIIATSSRLMTAFLGGEISRRLKVPLYLDLRDIFVDTLSDMQPAWLFRPASRFFKLIESRTISRAFKVNLVSAGFEAYFVSRFSNVEFSVFPNGIDQLFAKISHGPSIQSTISKKPYSVLYAGNIGEGQGLHTILPDLAEKMRDTVSFTVVGDGGRRKNLEKSIDEKEISNIKILDPVPRSELVRAYQNSDILFLHLNDHDAFKKVLPSKVFEYAATGKPIWAGVPGYASYFITQSIENAEVFPPCDVEAAEAAFSKLSLQCVPRPAFIAKFSRRHIMDALVSDILLSFRKVTRIGD